MKKQKLIIYVGPSGIGKDFHISLVEKIHNFVDKNNTMNWTAEEIYKSERNQKLFGEDMIHFGINKEEHTLEESIKIVNEKWNEEKINDFLNDFLPEGTSKEIIESYKKLISKLEANSGYEKIITSTTRDPREGEVNGVNYNFKTTEEFKKSIEDGKLVEHAEFAGKFYGLEKDSVVKNFGNNKEGTSKNSYIIMEPIGLINLLTYLQSNEFKTSYEDVETVVSFFDGTEKLMMEFIKIRQPNITEEELTKRFAELNKFRNCYENIDKTNEDFKVINTYRESDNWPETLLELICKYNDIKVKNLTSTYKK
ncbi:MAG: hypothetical protein ACRC4M_02970, partial [Mycoplasma sp.]